MSTKLYNVNINRRNKFATGDNPRKIAPWTIFIDKEAADKYVKRGLGRWAGWFDETDFLEVVETDLCTRKLSAGYLSSTDWNHLFPRYDREEMLSNNVIHKVFALLLNFNERQSCDFASILNRSGLTEQETKVHTRYWLKDFNWNKSKLTRKQLHAVLYVSLGGNYNAAHKLGLRLENQND